MVPSLEMTLSGGIEEIASVLDRLEGFCKDENVSAEKASRLGVVLDELITNTIMYGLKDQPDPKITVIVQRHKDFLEATISDNGVAFNPLEMELERASGDIEDLKVGGLGILMVKSFVDKLNYLHEHGLNKISIEIKIS